VDKAVENRRKSSPCADDGWQGVPPDYRNETMNPFRRALGPLPGRTVKPRGVAGSAERDSRSRRLRSRTWDSEPAHPSARVEDRRRTATPRRNTTQNTLARDPGTPAAPSAGEGERSRTSAALDIVVEVTIGTATCAEAHATRSSVRREGSGKREHAEARTVGFPGAAGLLASSQVEAVGGVSNMFELRLVIVLELVASGEVADFQVDGLISRENV